MAYTLELTTSAGIVRKYRCASAAAALRRGEQASGGSYYARVAIYPVGQPTLATVLWQ